MNVEKWMNGESRLPLLVVAGVALLLMIIHVIWPDLGIDEVTIGLLVVVTLLVVLPVLPRFVKRVSTPWGVIDLHVWDDVTDGLESVLAGDEHKGRVGSSATKAESSFPEVKIKIPRGRGGAPAEGGEARALRKRATADLLKSSTDPSDAISRFTHEIESRVMTLAEKHQIKDLSERPIGEVVNELEDKRFIVGPMARSIRDIVSVGADAAKGRPVDPRITTWVHDRGPVLLDELDARWEL